MPSTVVVIRNNFSDIARRLPVAVGEIVQRAAFEVEGEAKQLVRVDTGNLKNSIATEFESQTSAVVYTNVSYSVFQELGTVNMSAGPFMVPAAETVRPRFINALRDLERHLG